MDTHQITIKPFQREDQETVRNLILDGLAEHWDRVDPTLNPDLNDIGASYQGGIFLVAWFDGEIVGSGALVPRSDHVAEIVRMSVAAKYRRHGIGRKILERLYQEAEASGFQRIVLETSSTWSDAITFYRRFGFGVTCHRDGPFGGEVHFALDLTAASGR